MSELLAPFGASPEVVQEPAEVVEAPRAPVLITEQEVLFATAAGVPLRPDKTGRRWADAVRALGASVTALFERFGDDARPKPRHYPPRNDYLEDSRMRREMLRL